MLRIPSSRSTVCGLFLEQMQRDPDRIAVVDGDRPITYGQLAARAQDVADELLERAMIAGVLVTLWLFVARLSCSGRTSRSANGEPGPPTPASSPPSSTASPSTPASWRPAPSPAGSPPARPAIASEPASLDRGFDADRADHADH